MTEKTETNPVNVSGFHNVAEDFEQACGEMWQHIEHACQVNDVDYETESEQWIDRVTFQRTPEGWVTTVEGSRK